MLGMKVAPAAGMTSHPPPLRVCDACARHVFVTETTCPFCAAVLVPSRARPRFKLNPRLSRAQRFVLAGAFAAGLIGCAESPRLEPPYGASFPQTGGHGASGRGGVGGDAAPGPDGGISDEDAGNEN
jgi:hypothetical protein